MPASRPRRKEPPAVAWSQVPAMRAVPTLAEDVRRGLLSPPRSLPPKYFYDEQGARLFEQICQTPEYYPTRTEDALLTQIAAELMGRCRPRHLVELGSGSSRKTRRLLDAWAALGATGHYWPFDVSVEMLLASGAALQEEYDWLQVHALVGDYTAGLAALPVPAEPALWLFLGGTIGNFAPAEAAVFLRELRGCLGADGQLLLAVDRVKDAALLEAAYNDAAGVTARFNLNLLNVLNRELGADFDPAAYAHRAVFNADAQQIEMYLDLRQAQEVRVPALELTLQLAAGESILTEISRKFTPESLAQLLAAGGLRAIGQWDAPGQAYSLVLVEAAG